ncbi:MAG: purine-nucleoside phosphorylase [Planctomycetia bacterium]|nr:purine-nucleoside phosphorylase [Planctomycetia bacterium]
MMPKNTRASADVGRPRLRMGRPRDGAVDAAERVVAAGGCPATIGVVLGTGLGGLADRLTGRWAMPSTETGWLAKSMATGHAGRIVCGSLRGVPVAMLQGRVHGYEGFPPETLTRGVELLAALGVSQVLLTNASGGLEPDMVSGELVIVTDHIDLVRRPWGECLEADDTGEPERTTFYDPELVALALRATRRVDATARKGVYAFLSGPSYETRAEYRMLRRLGGDVVGMSTVPEVVAATRMGLDVAVCSVVTNVARPDAPTSTTTDAEDVCKMAAGAAEGVWAILESLAARAAGRPCVSC